jgi:hemoglobin
MLLNSLKSLYKNIGGESALETIVQDFYERMSRDNWIGFFFDGKDIAKIAHQQKNFLMQAMGVNKNYKGKTPSRAHDKMPPILVGHFDRRMVLLKQTLQDHGLQAKDIQTWLNFENTFREAILDRSQDLKKSRHPRKLRQK